MLEHLVFNLSLKNRLHDQYGTQRGRFRMHEGPGTAMRVDRGSPYSSDLARGDVIQIQLHFTDSRHSHPTGA